MDASLDLVRESLVRGVERAFEQEAAGQVAPLTILQRTALCKRVLLREAATAAAIQLLAECSEAGQDRWDEVYRARRFESRTLRDLVKRAKS